MLEQKKRKWQEGVKESRKGSQIYTQIATQTDRQIDRYIDRQIDRYMPIYIHTQIDRQIDRQMDRQIDRQIDWQMLRYIDYQVDKLSRTAIDAHTRCYTLLCLRASLSLSFSNKLSIPLSVSICLFFSSPLSLRLCLAPFPLYLLLSLTVSYSLSGWCTHKAPDGQSPSCRVSGFCCCWLLSRPP